MAIETLLQGRRTLGLACLLLLGLEVGVGAQSVTPLAPAAPTHQVTIPAEIPLRIAITRRARLKPRELVQAKLLEPVYVGAELVLPTYALVAGHIAATPPADRATRRDALLNGDLTPLHVPVIAFESVQLPEGGPLLRIDAEGRVRQASLIRFVPRPKQSRLARLKQMARDRIHARVEQVRAPHKSDRLLQFAFGQLPYHPQRVWAETAFDAPLRAPLVVPVAPVPEIEYAPTDAMLRESPIVEARLLEGVSSDTAKSGDAVHAVLTQPAFDHQHRLLFPEGAALTGVVLRARPSRSLGRNGTLRFAFRSMQPLAGAAQPMQGQVTGAEGQDKANVTVDEEGGVHANPAKDRFLGPLVLAVLAAGGNDEDGGAARQGTASNGLGIVVRLVSVAAGSGQFALAVGAYGFAKSVYRHFLAHGQPVSFPRNTAVEVQLSQRR